MLYFDRTDVSEGIVSNKKSESKECGICHYWHFLDKWFNFQLHVCNLCHCLLMMSMNFGHIAILNNKGSGYCCIIISKSAAINLIQNIDLTEKSRIL